LWIPPDVLLVGRSRANYKFRRTKKERGKRKEKEGEKKERKREKGNKTT
jgi:hypothetical protein